MPEQKTAKEIFGDLIGSMRGQQPARAVDCMEQLYLMGAVTVPVVGEYMKEAAKFPMIQQEIQSRLMSRDSAIENGQVTTLNSLHRQAFSQLVDLSLATRVLEYGSDPSLNPLLSRLAGKYGVLPADYTIAGDAGYYELKAVAGVNIIEQAKEYLAHSKKIQETLSGDPQSFIGYLKTLPPIPVDIFGIKFVGRIGPIAAKTEGDTIKTEGIFLANGTEAPFDAILQIDPKGRIKVTKQHYDLSNFNKKVQVGGPVFIDRIIGNIDSQLTGIINKNIGENWQVGYYGLKDKKMSITFVKKVA